MKENEEGTILKLNKIFKLHHYVPARGSQSYSEKHNGGFCFSNIVNCFAHACFNLTNDQLNDFSTLECQCYFGHKIDYLEQPTKEIKANLFYFIKDTGLTVRRTFKSAKLKENQWLVALYFGIYLFDGKNQDFHFLLKEKDGTWSGKIGTTQKVEYYKIPPKDFVSTCNYKYKLDGFYVITNPYLENTKEEEENEKEE